MYSTIKSEAMFEQSIETAKRPTVIMILATKFKIITESEAGI
jgi:hypothetical protein